MTTVFIMKKFVTVWCFAVLFNQALSHPTSHIVREDLVPRLPNELSEYDEILFVTQDGIYEIDSDILSSVGQDDLMYDDYDLSTRETERFFDALELNAKINSGDIMSEYYNGKPQPEMGVEYANEYSLEDMPGAQPIHFDETQSYLKYLQEIERDSKEKRQKAIFNNILDQELDDRMEGRYKRSAVDKMATLLNDVGKSKLRHDSIKLTKSIPSTKMVKLMHHLKNSKLFKPVKVNSAVNKMGKLLHDIANSKPRNSEKRSKRSASVEKVVNLIDNVNLKLKENSNKRMKRSLSSVDKVAKLFDDVNVKLTENSNKRMKRSLSSVDKVAKLFDDVNLKLTQNSNKRMKRSLSSVDKVAKLFDDVNVKLAQNSNKRMKRSLSSVDKMAKLIDDANFKLKENSNRRLTRSISYVDKVAKLVDSVNLKLKEHSDKRFKRSPSSVEKMKQLINDVGNKNLKGVILKNEADCGGMGGRRGNPDDNGTGSGSGSGDGPSDNPDSEDATNLRLTNMKRFNKRKQKKAVQ